MSKCLKCKYFRLIIENGVLITECPFQIKCDGIKFYSKKRGKPIIYFKKQNNDFDILSNTHIKYIKPEKEYSYFFEGNMLEIYFNNGYYHGGIQGKLISISNTFLTICWNNRDIDVKYNDIMSISRINNKGEKL